MTILSKRPKGIPKTQLYRVAAIAIVLWSAVLFGSFANQLDNIALVLGGMILLGMLALMFVRPETTTVIVLFVLYANLTVVAVRSYNVPELLAASFFMLLGLPLLNYVMIRRQGIIINHIFFLMLVYLGVILVSAVASRDAGDSTDRILSYLIEGLVLYFLIINTVRTPDLLRKGVWALILAGCLMGGISLYQELTGDYDNDFGGLAKVKASEIDTGEVDSLGNDVTRRRLAGPIGSKNRYGQVMVVLLPLALFRIWAERSRRLRILAAAACVPIISGALLTFSRGAGLSVVITLLVMVILRIIKLWHFLVIAVAASLVVLVAIPDYVHRISTVTDVAGLASGGTAGIGTSVLGRATENLGALNIFVDYPVLGVGPGQTNLYMTAYANKLGLKMLEGTRRAHSMYLEELSDTGIVGFTVFLSIVLFTMYQLAKARRRWTPSRPDIAYTATGFLLAIIAYLVSAFFLHLSYIRYYWLLLALAGAAIQIFHTAPPIESGLSENDARDALSVPDRAMASR